MTELRTHAGHYRFWRDQSSLSPMGEWVKMWVERKYLSILLSLLPRRSEKYKLLELGPGAGHFANVTTAAGFEYFAVDSSPSIAEELKGQGLRVANGVFPDEDPFPDDQFDVIYLSHVLEHCDGRKEACALIMKCREKLVPGGLLFINCPDVMSHGIYFWITDYTHNFVTTPKRVENLLSDLGFVTVLEKKSILGIYNGAGRLILKFFFLFFRPGLLGGIQKFFKPSSRSGAEVFAFENFTIAARRMR